VELEIEMNHNHGLEKIRSLRRESRGIPALLLLSIVAVVARPEFVSGQAHRDSARTVSKKEQRSALYMNKEFGFRFNLPQDWRGFTVIREEWRGTWREHAGQDLTGPVIRIRHPRYAENEPYEDIPIMIFTHEQWKSVDKEDLIVSAAPFPPGEIARNSKYVFATPPRFYYDFATGWQEVLHILGNRAHTFAPMRPSARASTPNPMRRPE
jgi:hypothetical protein